MTRSFDRRVNDAYDRHFRAALNIEKEETVSLDLDCMCEKNDPNCAECWVGSPYIGDVPPVVPGFTSFSASTNPKPVQVEPFPDQFDRDVRYRFDECLELLLRKHKAYGPSNIGNAPGGALNGLQVRMHDKLARINNLIATGHKPESEPLRDSFLDLANYSVIALMVLDGVWPSR